MFKLKTLSQVVAATVATSFLVGCGGGSSSSSGSASSDTTEVSGSVFASYVAGAELVVTDGVNKIAGPVITDGKGNFKITLGNEQLKNNLFFVATGGSYTDEATGTEGVNSERLAVYAAANTLGGNPAISATPSSSLIERLIVEYGLTEEAAKAAFEAAFGYQPDTAVTPVDATQDSTGASEEAKLAGIRAAAFSQLLNNLGLDAGDHKALLDALAEDLANGVADGQGTSGAVQLKGASLHADIANKISTALFDFASDSDKNKTGLNTGKVGQIKFNNTAISENYTYTLTPPEMGASEGKTTFKLTVTDSNGPVVGETPMMMPMMYMASGHMHSTPSTGCSMTDASGVAECTVYFLMPSVMGNGDVMGNWDLMFSVGMGDNAESVHFFPKVMMAMGDDTVKLKLEGGAGDLDHVQDMMGNDAGRKYYIFKEAVTGTAGNHTVQFFVATQDNMMSFPALNDDGTASGDLAGAVVSVYAENLAATSKGDGIWEIANVGNLVDGQQVGLELKLAVNGEGKSVATFNLTPKSM